MNKLNDEDFSNLEALIVSPVHKSLMKLIDQLKEGVYSGLLVETDAPALFRLQGRLIALNSVANMPKILTEEALKRRLAVQSKEKQAKKQP